MNTISINLLPVDSAQKQKRQRKFRLVQLVSTGILLVLIFLASGAVSLRILQTQNIKKIQNQVEASESSIVSQKDKESGLLVLKSRLDIISKYIGKVSKQVSNYNFISEKTTASINVSSISVDSTGTILISVLATNGQVIDNFIESLLSEEAAAIFSKVEIESLSRGRDASYRASIKLVSK